jgi:hypothetical protein
MDTHERRWIRVLRVMLVWMVLFAISLVLWTRLTNGSWPTTFTTGNVVGWLGGGVVFGALIWRAEVRRSSRTNASS